MTILGSSSKGNCYVLQNDSEAIIIEAGVKLSEVKKALGWNTAKVKVCIISHRHNDHAGHAAEYEKAGIPLLALPSVIEAKNLEATTTTAIKDGCGYIYGGFKILPFKVKHDVPCVGFLIEHQETTVEALGPMIEALQAQGVELLPITEDTTVIQHISADSVQ